MIADTGTTLILGPTSILKLIAQLFRGTYNTDYGRYQVNCFLIPVLPTIKFTIGGTAFTLRPLQYITIVMNYFY